MGLLTGIVSTVGGFIGGFASKIGAAVCGFAKGAINVLNKINIPGLDLNGLIGKVANIVQSVLDVLGINSEESPEILGAKAGQCEKNTTDFDSTEEYIRYLKEEMKLDKEKFDKMTPEEKMGCKAVGIALETKAIEEKIDGVSISPECLGMLTKMQIGGINISGKDLVRIIQILKEEGITNLNDVVEYLEGSGESNRLKTGDALVIALGENGETKVNELKETIRKYEED